MLGRLNSLRLSLWLLLGGSSLRFGALGYLRLGCLQALLRVPRELDGANGRWAAGGVRHICLGSRLRLWRPDGLRLWRPDGLHLWRPDGLHLEADGLHLRRPDGLHLERRPDGLRLGRKPDGLHLERGPEGLHLRSWGNFT